MKKTLVVPDNDDVWEGAVGGDQTKLSRLRRQVEDRCMSKKATCLNHAVQGLSGLTGSFQRLLTLRGGIIPSTAVIYEMNGGVQGALVDTSCLAAHLDRDQIKDTLRLDCADGGLLFDLLN